MAILNALGIRNDPLLNHNFLISLLDTSSTLGVLKSAAVAAVSDIALGNVVGSNIVNILVVLGVSAMVAPLTVQRQIISATFR